MANTTKETVAFRCDIDQSLPHPDEMCIVTFLGRAEITIEKECSQTESGSTVTNTFLSAEIIDLWLGVDVPPNLLPYHFRKVSVPGSKVWRGVENKLEEAALDQYESPMPVTLPDEVRPLEVSNLIASEFFGRPQKDFVI